MVRIYDPARSGPGLTDVGDYVYPDEVRSTKALVEWMRNNRQRTGNTVGPGID